MALNQDFVGRSFPSGATYVVGREKIREFAAAIGDENPVFRDVDAARALGYDDIVAPPTFAIVLSLNAAMNVVMDPDLGLDFTRVVHSEQQFTYTRPIVAGDELTVTTVIESARTVAGNDILTTKGVITTIAGEPVATASSTLLSRAVDA